MNNLLYAARMKRDICITSTQRNGHTAVIQYAWYVSAINVD